MWRFMGFLALAIVFVLLVWWLDPTLRRLREFEAELVDREPLSDEEMLSRYFAVDAMDKGVPAQVRRIFAKHMGYSAEKLLPDEDLTFFWAELDMKDLIEDLESGFGITISKVDAERTPCTIRAASLLVASKIKPRKELCMITASARLHPDGIIDRTSIRLPLIRRDR